MSRPLLLCTDVNYIFIIVIFISALKEGKISIKYERCSRFYKMVVSIYQSLGLVERGECQIKNLKLLDEPYGKHFNFGYSSNVQEKRIIRYLNQKIRGFFDGNYSDYIYLSTAKYCGSLYYSHGLSLLH